MPQFLTVVLPLTVVFVLGFLLEFRAQMGAAEARFFTHERSIIERAVSQVQRELEIATRDLVFAADLGTGAMEEESPERLSALAESLLALAKQRPGYAQIRVLDATGQEILRVENATTGARLMPESVLQDKSSRDYFSEAMRLAAGEVFVSPMELNIERGAVQDPVQPVVRLATPIDDSTGKRRGIVVVNVRGEQFLSAFPRSTDKAGVQHMIVDFDGYWLQHRPEVEWGFVLAHGMSFRRTFPEMWEQMAATRQGQLESSDGLFYFDSVARRVSAGRSDDVGQEEPYWMLVSLVPRVVLDDITAREGTRLLVIAIPFYFALLAVGWLLAAGLERRRAADEALHNLEYVRSSMLRAALDAIIVMDQTGITLEFNPAAQQVFGYSLEEARGKPVADLIIPPVHREAHRLGLKRYLASGEGRFVGQHIGELTGIRKDGVEIPVELTICPMTVAGRRLFCGFIRDLSEPEPKPSDGEGG
jgi:PAS domain S-box-containing protein